MKIEKKYGNLIADTTCQSVTSVDQALKDNLLLFNTILEVSEASKTPLKIDQKLVEQCSEGLLEIVNARRSMVRLIDSIYFVQKKSSLADQAFGCPRGYNDKAPVADEPKSLERVK